MKRIAGIALPLLLAAACTGTDNNTTATGRSKTFTAGYDMGTQVVLQGRTTQSRNQFVELDGKVTQVDDFDSTVAAVGTNAACNPDVTNKTKTVFSSEATMVTKTRIAGVQKAWMLPSNFGTAGIAGENGTNVWGDPSSGWLFLTEPSLDILLNVQNVGAGDNRHLTQYLKTIPLNLYVFENDSDSTYKSLTTVSTVATNSLTTVDRKTAGGNLRTLNTYTRFDIDNFVWQTGFLNNLYSNAPINYGASMVVPESVKVGDTWLANNGNLMSAVGVDAIDVGNATVRALHVVERGHTDVDLSATGVDGWCVNFYSNFKDNTTEGKTTEITDNCNGTGAFAGLGNDQVATGWVNLRHTWYYKGLPVKVAQDTVNVSVQDYGYAVPNTNGTLPGGINRYGAVGQCAFYYNSTPGNIASTQISMYKPFARYTVTTTHEEAQAIEVKNGFTIAKEYAVDKAAK